MMLNDLLLHREQYYTQKSNRKSTKNIGF